MLCTSPSGNVSAARARHAASRLFFSSCVAHECIVIFHHHRLAVCRPRSPRSGSCYTHLHTDRQTNVYIISLGSLRSCSWLSSAHRPPQACAACSCARLTPRTLCRALLHRAWKPHPPSAPAPMLPSDSHHRKRWWHTRTPAQRHIALPCRQADLEMLATTPIDAHDPGLSSCCGCGCDCISLPASIPAAWVASRACGQWTRRTAHGLEVLLWMATGETNPGGRPPPAPTPSCPTRACCAVRCACCSLSFLRRHALTPLSGEGSLHAETMSQSTPSKYLCCLISSAPSGLQPMRSCHLCSSRPSQGSYSGDGNVPGR